ncbi:MAG: serine--tRNA ligase, partial [Gammaproteobacteria bacterium]
MLDPRLIRNELEATAQRLAARGFTLDVKRLGALEAERKQVQVEAEQLQAERNAKSKAIGKAKASGEDAAPLMSAVADLGDKLKQAEARLAGVQQRLEEELLGVPNLPHETVPTGKNEHDNVEIRRWGEPKKLDFTPRDHVDLGAAIGQMDFDAAAKISGARFVVLSGALARLQRALTQFMLDVHTGEHGYTEVYVPYIVNADSLRGTGQLPKFEEDLFCVPRSGFEATER